MTPQLLETARWMDANGRIFRSAPVTGLPLPERFNQVDRLLDKVWFLAKNFGFNLGNKPTIITTGAPMSPPPVMLHAITELQLEVFATNLMCGLGSAMGRSIYEITNKKPGQPSPNYRTIVDETFTDEEADSVFPN